MAGPLPDGVGEGVPDLLPRGRKVSGRWWAPGRTDLPATWSARVNPVTVMSRAPALKRMTVALRTRPFSPVRLVENVVLITGPTTAPARAPHWPLPNAPVMTVPTAEPRMASSSVQVENPGACFRSWRNDWPEC